MVVAEVVVEVIRLRLVILDEALLTIKAPETDRAVVEEKVVVSVVTVKVPTLRLEMVEEALLAMKPPLKYDKPVVVAETTEILVGAKLAAVRVPET